MEDVDGVEGTQEKAKKVAVAKRNAEINKAQEISRMNNEQIVDLVKTKAHLDFP